jgi:hypothetical protein
MSLNLNPSYVASHWESVEEGARRSGRTPRRADWRLVREIFIADSDEEAWRLSVDAQMGRMMREYFLPLLTNVGVIQFLKHDPEVAALNVTPSLEQARHCPATTAQIRRSRVLGTGEQLGCLGDKHAVVGRVADHDGAGPQHAAPADPHMIANRAVDPEKTAGADRYPARNHDMRGNKDIILDRRVMADMVAAPQRDVVADPHPRLDRVVFENEAIIAHLEVGEDGRARTDIRDKLITERP